MSTVSMFQVRCRMMRFSVRTDSNPITGSFLPSVAQKHRVLHKNASNLIAAARYSDFPMLHSLQELSTT